MYYKTDRQKCTYDKIPKIRLHLWKGNSYNNYIMTRIESVILCFLWWELRTEENSLILRRLSSALCAESMGGIRSLWRIRYYRCFLFHASNGTGIIMCRWAAAIRCTSWIRKWERPLRAGSRWRFCRSIWRWWIREAVDTDTGAAATAGMRQQKILSFVRSVAIGFHVIDRGDGGWTAAVKQNYIK